MSSVAEAFVTLRPDTTGFGHHTEQQVQGELEGSDASRALSPWMARAGRAAGGAAAGGIAATITGGLRRALDREEAIVTFGRLGLSEQAIEQLTEEIDQALRGTTVTNPEGFALAGRLLAAGFDEADIPTITSQLADLAQVGNRDFAEMADVLVRAAGQGRFTAVELQRLGDVPIGKIAEELGLTEEEFRRAVAAGEITADVFLEAFGAVDEFRDAAKDETTRQALSNLITAFSSTGEAIVGPTVEAGLFREAIVEVRDSLGRVRPFFETLGQISLPLMRGAMWLVEAAAKGAAQQFEFWSGVIEGIIDVNRRLWGALTGLIAPVVGFIRTTVVPTFVRWYLRVRTGMSEMRDNIAGGIAGIIMWFRRLPRRIRSAIPNPLKILSGIGRSIIQGLWNGMTDRFDGVRGWLSGIGGTIRSLKGPLAYDKVMLTPQGEAVMEGFHAGLQGGWRDVERFLKDRTSQLAGLNVPAGQSSTVNQTVTINGVPDAEDVGMELRKLAIGGVYG